MSIRKRLDRLTNGSDTATDSKLAVLFFHGIEPEDGRVSIAIPVFTNPAVERPAELVWEEGHGETLDAFEARCRVFCMAALTETPT